MIKQNSEEEIFFRESTDYFLQCPWIETQQQDDGTEKRIPCLGTDLRTCGRDKKHSAQPWSLKCTKCGHKCYPHTSYQFCSMAESFAQKLLNGIFKDHQSLTSLSEEYNFSTANLSLFAEKFRSYINDQILLSNFAQQINSEDPSVVYPSFNILFHQNLGILDTNKELNELFGQSSNELVWECSFDISGLMVINESFYAALKGETTAGTIDYSKIMVIDETFLKIGGISFLLIVAVSRDGNLLSWVLTRSRSTDVLNKLFLSALENYPFPGIILTDGFSGYKAMVKCYQYSIIHIVHIHKPPYNRVIITQRFYFPDQNKVKELEIGVFSDIFATSGQKPIYYKINEKPIQKVTNPRGRPKGRKNRPKAEIEKEKKLKGKRKKKKRGRKNIFKTGDLHFIEVDLEQSSIVFDSQFDNFSQVTLLMMLVTVFVQFKGIHITSNYVENFFSQFKFFLNRGRRSNSLTFLKDFQVYVLKYQDRVWEKDELTKKIGQFLNDFPPSPGLAYRNFFKSPFVPYLISLIN